MLKWPNKATPDPDNQPPGFKLTLELSDPLARELAQVAHKGFTKWLPWSIGALVTGLGLTGFLTVRSPEPDPVLKQSSPEVCPPQESQNG